MVENPQVSICCITYNHEAYIRDCLEGFLMQKTNFAYEILIHDDASTDKTADIIREYEAKYPDIIKPIYQTENQYSKGKKAWMNFLFPKAQGKYIAICEGDDFWVSPDKLQIQFDFMEANPDYSMCGCKKYFWNEFNKTYCPAKEYSTENDDLNTADMQIRFIVGTPFHTSSFFIRRSSLFDVFDQLYSDSQGANASDTLMCFYLSQVGKLKLLSERMTTYRIHANSAMAYCDKQKRLRTKLIAFSEHIKFAIKHGREDVIPILITCNESNFIISKKSIKDVLFKYYLFFSKRRHDFIKAQKLTSYDRVRYWL